MRPCKQCAHNPPCTSANAPPTRPACLLVSHSDYTFPREATIRDVHFDDEHMHVELADGRIMSVPLRWIPTVYHASPEERAKYELNRSRTMIIWDPAKCAINDEIRITDYFGPVPG